MNLKLYLKILLITSIIGFIVGYLIGFIKDLMWGIMKKEYYSAKDIADILGCCLATSYETINKLNKLLQEKYPNVIIMKNKIPIWFWNICTKRVEK